ncbi:MAG TPA: hypothetical protein DEF07_04220 [Nitrosomonas sp.]|nr:hypothetical protein [Nitrosomonas sp.]
MLLQNIDFHIIEISFLRLPSLIIVWKKSSIFFLRKLRNSIFGKVQKGSGEADSGLETWK